MKTTNRQNNGISIIDFCGSIRSSDELDDLSQVIKHETNKSNVKLLLDFKEVDFINSSGLGRLILAAKKLSEESGTLSIMNLSEELDELFTFTKLKEKIATYKNEEEAISAITSGHATI